MQPGRRRRSRRRAPGPLPGRRRRAALADPPRARAGRARRAGRAALRAAPALRASRRGRTSSRCTGRRDGEAYVTPVGADLVGVAVLDRRRGAVRRAPARRFPGAARPGCAAAGRSTAVRGAGPLRQRVAGAGWPGGCCWSATPPGYVDALTGEGIAVSLAERAGAGRVPAARPAAGLRAGLAAGVAPLPGAHRVAAARPGPPRPGTGRGAGGRTVAVGVRQGGGPARRVSGATHRRTAAAG